MVVKVADIYKDIIKRCGWENYSEAKERLLRMKYTVLQQKLVLCDKKEFKEKGKNVVPWADAPIVRNILMAAVGYPDDNIVAEWFIDKVDTSDSYNAILLYNCMKPLIMQPCICGETDEVTMDEWLRTVATAINYNTAIHVTQLDRALEDFRNNTLALDMNIGIADVTVTHEDGSRSYALRGKERDINIDGKTIDEVLSHIASQDDYFAVLGQILEKFNAHAKERTHKAILWYAKAKNTFEAKSAADAVTPESIASEYIVWYQRIHEFLKANPEICRSIEQEANVTGLEDFFRMEGR